MRRREILSICIPVCQAADDLLLTVTVAVPTVLVGGVSASWNAEQVMLFTPGSSSPRVSFRLEINMMSSALVTGPP